VHKAREITHVKQTDTITVKWQEIEVLFKETLGTIGVTMVRHESIDQGLLDLDMLLAQVKCCEEHKGYRNRYIAADESILIYSLMKTRIKRDQAESMEKQHSDGLWVNNMVMSYNRMANLRREVLSKGEVGCADLKKFIRHYDPPKSMRCNTTLILSCQQVIEKQLDIEKSQKCQVVLLLCKDCSKDDELLDELGTMSTKLTGPIKVICNRR